MKNLLLTWQFWAVLSAGFAALTAIFAKVGVENVNSDFATFVRTVVILATVAAILRRLRRAGRPPAAWGAAQLGFPGCFPAWPPAPPGSAISGH